MTPEQLTYWVQATGWPPEQVLAWYTYFATGQPG